MSPRDYWNLYVSNNGGPVGVAKKLEIPFSTIAGICNGSRGIGRVTARRMVQQDPLLDENQLIWVVSGKKPAKQGAPRAKVA